MVGKKRPWRKKNASGEFDRLREKFQRRADVLLDGILVCQRIDLSVWIRTAVVVAMLAPAVASAQVVELTVAKDGDDVELTFSGGGAPYEILASRQPQMSIRTDTVDDQATSPTLHVGALTDGIKNWFYIVCSIASPTITITSPLDGFTIDRGCISAAGTYSVGTEQVYVNTFAATMLGGGLWTCCEGSLGAGGVPLAVAPGVPVPIIAAGTDAGSDWCHARIDGTYTGSGVSRFECAERKAGQ